MPTLPPSQAQASDEVAGAGRDLRIGDLARATGKSARALRLYEEMGLLTPGTRTAGGFRVYDDQAVDRVRWIAQQQDLGFTLHEVRDLIAAAACPGVPKEAMAEVRHRYRQKLQELTAHIDRLSELKTELEASLSYLEECHACGLGKAGAQACLTCNEHHLAAPRLVTGVTQSAAAAARAKSDGSTKETP